MSSLKAESTLARKFPYSMVKGCLASVYTN